MIWTFAFEGAEYWCPYCGFAGSMLGSGITVNQTPELIKRWKLYLKSTKDYLHAQGTTCCSCTVWQGQQIKTESLPQKEKDRLEKIRNEYKYEVKIEESQP